MYSIYEYLQHQVTLDFCKLSYFFRHFNDFLWRKVEFLSVCLQMKRSSLEDLMSGKHLVELEPQHQTSPKKDPPKKQ